MKIRTPALPCRSLLAGDSAMPPSACRRQSQNGSVLLVALCFVTVLGISLASYVAVCSRTMQISNRTAQTALSRQLAEMGLEEALRAFNSNDWRNWSNGPAVNWTVSGTTATATLTFPAGTFGQGLTGSVKIRVDNYNAAQLDSVWNSTTTYNVNDLVGYNGIWYRCLQSHSNQTPGNLAYWAQAPIPWAWSSNTAYTANTGSTNNSVIFDGSTWYYCNTSHTSGNASTLSADSANTAKWTAMAAPTLAWTSGTSYSVNQQVYNVGDRKWYRCKTAHISTASFDSAKFDQGTVVISWRWQSTHVYLYNQVVYYNETWYRCVVSSSSGNVPTGASGDWENAFTGMSGWSSSGLKYNLGDAVYHSATSQWYRCILAHTSSGSITPTNTTYWTNAPRLPTAWSSTKQYSQNDTVHYNGVWYLSLQNANTNQNPATATTYWIGANTGTASYQWNNATAYSAGSYKCYGGVWYKCISATTANAGHSPNNTSYWTSGWAQSSGVTSGAPVVYAQGTIAYADGSISRTQVRATLARAPLFPNALAANSSTITANSGGTVDSYDSTTGTVAVQNGVANTTTPNLNSGTYASHANTSTNFSAVAASGYSAGTAITLSSATVKGYLAAPSSTSSPYTPLYSSGGTVKGFSSPASPNIDLTRISRSPYIPKFDTIPGGAGGLATNWATTPKGTLLALSTTTNIGTPGATRPSSYYYSGNLTIGTATIQYLNINGPVILYVNGDLFITASGSTGRININNNGSAEIHVTGAFKADLGGEGIQNYTSDPKSLIIISDTTGTARHFYSEGIYDLYGVVYIPYSTSTDGFYNDNTAAEIFGAVSANKITYSGANLNVHYDTSLRYATFGGVDQPHAVAEWRELTDPSEQATMP